MNEEEKGEGEEKEEDEDEGMERKGGQRGVKGGGEEEGKVEEEDEVWSVDITDVTPTEPCGVLLLILSIDDAMSRAIMLNLKEQ
jgi:hypothetical protein